MTITMKNLDAGLEALKLPSSSADRRKNEAREHFRTAVAEKGVKPEVAVREALTQAMKDLKSDRDARLKAGKNSAGITLAAKTKSVSATVSQRLPKRQPTQRTFKTISQTDQHWSHSDLKLGAFLLLFWGLAAALFLMLAPVVYSAYNAQYGVGAGTGACFGLAIGLIVITFIVNVGFRVKFNNDHPRPDLPLSSDKDLKAIGIKRKETS